MKKYSVVALVNIFSLSAMEMYKKDDYRKPDIDHNSTRAKTVVEIKKSLEELTDEYGLDDLEDTQEEIKKHLSDLDGKKAERMKKDSVRLADSEDAKRKKQLQNNLAIISKAITLKKK